MGTPVTDAPHALAGLPTTALPGVLSSAGGTIFTVWGSKKFVFPTFDDFFGLGFSLNMVGTVSPYTEGLFSGAFGGFHLAPGRLYKVSGADVVYLVNGASSLVVPSPNYFAYFDLPTTKTLTVDATTAARYPSAGMLPLAFKNGAGAVYIADGVKRVVSASMQTQYGLTVSSLTTLTDVAVSRLPDGAAATQFAKISNGQIFYITGGQRKYITTPATLVSLGANAGNIVNEPDEFILAMPDGGSL